MTARVALLVTMTARRAALLLTMTARVALVLTMTARRAALLLTLLGGVAHADDKLPPEAAAAPDAREPLWLTYAALRNDVFTELVPPINDRGFTHDNVFALRRRAGAYTFGGSFVHRIITSRIDRRRWDLVQLFATGERAMAFADTIALTTALRAGPALGGNWGGMFLQNGWHELTETGPTVDEGLANDYAGDRRFGFVLGGRALVRVGDRVQGYGFVDGQVALGTGVTSAEAAVGASAASRHLGAHVELAVTRYHAGDANLALPGAYGFGFNVEWRIGVDVHWSRFRVGYVYRANEGGSGEPIGLIEFSSTR